MSIVICQFVGLVLFEEKQLSVVLPVGKIGERCTNDRILRRKGNGSSKLNSRLSKCCRENCFLLPCAIYIAKNICLAVFGSSPYIGIGCTHQDGAFKIVQCRTKCIPW